MQEVGSFLWTVLGRTAVQLLLLLGPAIAIGIAMHALAVFTARHAVRVVGRKVWHYGFAMLGTLVHELGHAMLCPLFGHRITRFQPFTTDPSAPVQGSVEHAYNPANPWAQAGNFFIAVGPLLSGSAAIYLLARMLLPSASFEALPQIDPSQGQGLGGSLLALARQALAVVLGTLSSLFRLDHLGRWTFWLFLFLSFSISTGVHLSTADLRGAWKGLLVLVLALLLLNLLLGLFLDPTAQVVGLLGPGLGVLLGVMVFALTLLALAALWFRALSGLRDLLVRPSGKESA
jgi:hypothetical protein